MIHNDRRLNKKLPRRKPNLEKLKYSRKNNSPFFKKGSETFSLQMGFLRLTKKVTSHPGHCSV